MSAFLTSVSPAWDRLPGPAAIPGAPNNRFGCWGCRGPADGANIAQLEEIMKTRGFSTETILDRLECFGGFQEYADRLRKKTEK